MILEQSDLVQENILFDMKQVLVLRKKDEEEKKIMELMNDQSYLKQMTSILKDNWENKSEEIVQGVKEKIKQLD